MTVKLGLVGTGTVGGGCLDILSAHRDDFKRLNGIDVELVRVCSRNSETAVARGVEDLFTTDFNDVINDPEVDIVIELIGGTTAAYDLVMGALRAGKNVVTANKALMATHGSEILELAREKGLEVAFEASVGGGIPIIGPLTHGLHANGVSSVLGIVNGTTNYMLTRMSETGATYDDALAEAQEKGFAEADPTADVDGFDAAAKIAILSTIAFNTPVNLDDVYTEGIRNIMPTDLAAAKEMGYCVKLLAIGNRTDAGVDVRVHPTMVPLSHPLATVNGVFNAIYVVGDAVGETMFFGEGAGAGAAASAVMGDVLEVARHVQQGCTNQVIPGNDGLSLVPMEELTTRYYIRFVVEDRRGVLASTARVFSDHDVSVYSVIQRGSNENVSGVDLVYITHTAQERDIRAAIQDIRALDGVLVSGQEPTVIRVQK
ncbi:homoserine dehydrogenase [Denitrobacterium detoxificans]|jgi:homoserine dehydrogenase|uniref:homoserine dehydrogenase n=1 Tax=Denitrobacterium detoxificans TaxID=79604 RepID=UPI0026F357AA|nr:homoserine dehydrogenase [Denitrobacterium detoxificans]MBE6466790.1 homoserine dehydrogenase [Denitrobacterium detoxificans]